jgi:AP-4 complex subunit beta-1
MAEPTFFSEMKKGEVNELRVQLRNATSEKDIMKVRGVVQKVISYMTSGIDMSQLFTDMVMVTNTRDLIQKKLVYLYLCNYAQANAELALLTINTLQKDCRDDNPMVRGLALRSCSSLRLPNTIEYVIQCVLDGLNDSSPYVRKTAVLGCGKLFSVSPTLMNHAHSSIVDKLYAAIRDKDPQVVINALHTLNEILAPEGGITLSRTIILYLFSRFKDFNDWGQAAILEFAATKFNEPTEQDIFDLLNLLDEKLKNANTAIVLAVVKLFLKLTESMPHIYSQVFGRVKPSLITLMEGSDSHEISYSVLVHILALVQKLRNLTEGADVLFGAPGDHKPFLCLYNEPLYLRCAKVKVLRDIAVTVNIREVIAELREQASSGDPSLSKLALLSIGDIAGRMPSIAVSVLETILELLALPLDYIKNTCVLVLRDFLRAYPDYAAQVLNHLCKYVPNVEDPEAKEALIWILGFFGKSHDDTPYLLESLADHFEEELPAIKLAILTACMRLLFARPAEMQPILGQVFEKALNLSEQPDLHDRALLYYRLLERSANEQDPNWVNTVSNVINAANASIGSSQTGFAEDESYEVRDKIFEEFNTLSIIYGKPAEEFARKKPLKAEIPAPQKNGGEEEVQEQPEEYVVIRLAPLPSWDPASFQSKWDSLEVSENLQLQLNRAPSARNVEELMGQHSVMSLASGTVNNVLKLYLYALEETCGEYILMEALVDLNTFQLTMTFKSSAPPEIVGEFVAQCTVWWSTWRY